MKRAVIGSVAFALCLAFAGSGRGAGGSAEGIYAQMRIVSGDRQAVIALYDNPLSRDFASLLPLEVSFRDYAGAEKITGLPRKLAIDGAIGRGEPGDFCYYAPWGNLAVFYQGQGAASGLYILGRIESGKDWLGNSRDDFSARIELIREG